LALLDLDHGYRALHFVDVGVRHPAGTYVARAYTKLGFLEYSFIETVEAMHPFYVIRALGGALFLIGALIMVWNLWRTVYPREAVAASGQPALVPAE
jgi:cbb3-type cytochrome oxidase subunit 1